MGMRSLISVLEAIFFLLYAYQEYIELYVFPQK